MIIKLMDIKAKCFILPSNDLVFIVGCDWLSTKQAIPAAIDPLIGEWPIVVKGLGTMDRQEEMQA